MAKRTNIEDTAQPVKIGIQTHDRVTINQNVYHDQYQQEPTQVGGSQQIFLQGKEDPYKRTITVDEETRPLDLGWLDSPGDVSFIVLENMAATPPGIKPTPEQIADRDSKTVIFGYESVPGFKLRPEGIVVFEPEDAKGIVIRCLSGSVKIKLTALPS